MDFDVIIVGAGAAGLICAIEAGKRGRRVLFIEKSAKIGEKIRISGGGRCNFTNIHTSPANYLSQNPHFCKSALGRYSPADFIALIEKHGITYHEKTLGQLFCDGSSKQIIAMLVAECEAVRAQIQTETDIRDITKTGGGFTLRTNRDETLHCESLVIATGGPSIPKMGATGWGYEVAKQFGLKLVEPRAALVPFTLDEPITALAGVSLEATAHAGQTEFREGMLFTHRGLSGPSILQISSYWDEGAPITLNLLPKTNLLDALKAARQSNGKQEIGTLLAQHLPKKLAQHICESEGYSGRLADCANAQLEHIAQAVQNWQITPDGTEGYRTAEVTLGGVDTDEISSKTMEAKKVAGLYFIGEVVDVTGWLGGYNFQWAWASGFAAGQVV
jgi:predicted Rossmann fold flavoprotein